MKRLIAWIRRKLFGPTIQETLTGLVSDINEQEYYEYPNVQGAHLHTESLAEFYKEKL